MFIFFFLFHAAGETDRHCIYINYFPTEEYSPDPNDSTLTIPCMTHKNLFFFLLFPHSNSEFKKNCQFVYSFSRRRFEVGSVLFHGYRSVGDCRSCLFPRSFRSQTPLLHFPLWSLFYYFRYIGYMHRLHLFVY